MRSPVWPPPGVVRNHRPDGYDAFKPIWAKPTPPQQEGSSR